MNFLQKLFRRPTSCSNSAELGPYLTALVASMRYEMIPISPTRDLARALDLPALCPAVSVTCSPKKGIAATRACCEMLLLQQARLQSDANAAPPRKVIPHFAARMVTGPEQTRQLAAWAKEWGVKEVFIVGGDAESPSHYGDALSFMTDFLSADSGVETINFTAYPEGHSSIDNETLHYSLRAKQDLLSSSGMKGVACTQLSFSGEAIKSWLRLERESGFSMPVHIGIPGAVAIQKLIDISIRLGVAATAQFADKNRSTVANLLAPGGYDPAQVLIEVGSRDAEDLQISGIHSCTFNSIKNTAIWQQALINGTRR